MSTNYGRNSTASNNFWQENQGTNNQYGYLVGGVPVGVISFLDVYMGGGLGGTCRTILCLWDYPSGTLLAQSAQFTAPAGGGGINLQGWRRAALTTPYRNTGAGAAFYIGFWRNGADAAEFSFDSSSGTFRPAVGAGVANAGSPTTLSVATGATGLMSAYLEWDPSGAYGSHLAGAPSVLQGIYGSHLAGPPAAIQGVYRGPAGGGAPIQIW